MHFSVNFKSTKKKQADEIRCPYNQLGRIYNFIKENSSKRYIIETDSDTDMTKLTEQIEFVKSIANEYSISCGKLGLMRSLIKAGYNAFLRFPVTDWETFTNLQELKVSDIYIDGPLGFQCKYIEKGKQDIKIRVSPTISPNANINGRSANSFFIRPEDLHLYSSTIDIIDFKEPNQEKEDVLFDIYTRGTFNFNINKLIEGLPDNVNNIFIKDEFAQSRLNCRQRCKIPTRSCHLCENNFVLSNHITSFLRDLFENKK